MSKKKILVVNPTTLFPVTMMSQVRTNTLIKRLARDHHVHTAALCRTPEQIAASREGLKDICHEFFPITPLNPGNAPLKRKYYGIKHLLMYYLAGIPQNYSLQTNKKIIRQLLDLVDNNRYDIVQVEYWYLGELFMEFPRGIYKVIDSHAMMEELIESYAQKRTNKKLSFTEARSLKKSVIWQYRCFAKADLVTTISRQGMDILMENAPGTNSLLVPIGQDIDHFKNYQTSPCPKTLLFYGALGNQQNLWAFSRLWESILPLIKEKIPDLKLMVLGSNPPDEIKQLNDGDKVMVTGYVQDPREYMAKANVMILPLGTGAGFRGRVVEAMAMGIPVVGTHNGLDSIEMTHGLHGFVTDSDSEMADAVVQLMTNPQLRQKISCEGLKFVTDRYSIEATAGQLSKYYAALEKN